jgi:hypothetical protein
MRAESAVLFAVDLLGLLKWRSNTNLLQQNLRQLMKVDGGEVVKVTRAAAAEGGLVLCFLPVIMY